MEATVYVGRLSIRLTSRNMQQLALIVPSAWDWLDPRSWISFLGYWLLVVIILSVLLSIALGLVSLTKRKRE